MTGINWNEVKTGWQDLKNDVQRDYMLRRYQKMLKGDKPVSDKVASKAVEAYTEFVTSWRLFVKRILDLTLSAMALVIFAPVMAVIAVAIKVTSPGPVLYRQTRVGFRGHQFDMLKFRSMRQDAELKTGPMWAQKDDPRVTRIGKFLRTSHLDELPQLINVIRGEMSIVGPRPERPHFVSQLRKEIPHYDRRHAAKPGITGLAQIKRSYDETIADVKKKVRYDVLYIKHMCPLLDVKLIASTVGTVVFRTGR